MSADDRLGLSDIAQVVDLVDAIKTERAAFGERLPPSMSVVPLARDDRSGLNPSAYAPPPDGQVLIGEVDPTAEADRDLLRAANIEREWLEAPGNHAVFLLTDDAHYVALQHAAPDLWSFRAGVHTARDSDELCRRRVVSGLARRLGGEGDAWSVLDAHMNMDDMDDRGCPGRGGCLVGPRRRE